MRFQVMINTFTISLTCSDYALSLRSFQRYYQPMVWTLRLSYSTVAFLSCNCAFWIPMHWMCFLITGFQFKCSLTLNTLLEIYWTNNPNKIKHKTKESEDKTLRLEIHYDNEMFDSCSFSSCSIRPVCLSLLWGQQENLMLTLTLNLKIVERWVCCLYNHLGQPVLWGCEQRQGHVWPQNQMTALCLPVDMCDYFCRLNSCWSGIEIIYYTWI